jgi:hypothetical protein
LALVASISSHVMRGITSPRQQAISIFWLSTLSLDHQAALGGNHTVARFGLSSHSTLRHVLTEVFSMVYFVLASHRTLRHVLEAFSMVYVLLFLRSLLQQRPGLNWHKKDCGGKIFIDKNHLSIETPSCDRRACLSFRVLYWTIGTGFYEAISHESMVIVRSFWKWPRW